ncbi:hypothetical protein ES703_106689 [subsurface metagenome]
MEWKIGLSMKQHVINIDYPTYANGIEDYAAIFLIITKILHYRLDKFLIT